MSTQKALTKNKHMSRHARIYVVVEAVSGVLGCNKVGRYAFL